MIRNKKKYDLNHNFAATARLWFLKIIKRRGGQTPHVLEKAFSWHTNYAKNRTMLESVVETV
ncbi:hypothetical protein CN354_02420 [Bacillus cereus]|nr:hypothetical protein CN354_02420 [Bacillus cereus]